MSPRQFGLLVKRYQRHREEADRRSGEIVAMLYNANRDSEKDPNGLEWRDFFPEWKPEPQEQTEEEMFQTMMLLAKSTEGPSS